MTESKEERVDAVVERMVAACDGPLTPEEFRLMTIVQQVVRYELERCGIVPSSTLTALWCKDDSK